MKSIISEMYEAAMIGSTETLDALMQEDKLILFKASLSSFHETPLHISALLGHLEFTLAVLARCPKMATELDSYKRTPLHLAAAEGHTEILRALLGVNTNVCLVRDQEGRIPLHLAAIRGRVEAIEELMRANPLSVGVKLDGDTTLQLCVKYNHFDALKLMMEKADFDDQLLSSSDQLLKSKNQKPTSEITTVVSTQEILKEAVAKPTNDVRIEVAELEVKSDSWFKKMLKKFYSHPSNWIQEARGHLMVVATVLAIVSYESIANPPEGVHSSTELPDEYKVFLAVNIIAFSCSIIVIFLIMSGAPFGNKFFIWIMMVAMYAAVMGIVAAMVTLIFMTIPLALFNQIRFIASGSLYVALAFVVVVLGPQFILFCLWISRKCFRMLRSDKYQ